MMKSETTSQPKEIPDAAVFKAAELVNYRDGSIARREIIKSSTGRSILVSANGQELSEHTASFDALVQVVEGETEIIISGQPQRLHGGEMILIPANQPRALKALQRFKMLLTKILP